MPQKYEISLINDETGETISIFGEFSDDEVKLLSRLRCVLLARGG